MTRRTAIIEQVGNYFASKGKTMSLEEYKTQEDAPIRFQLIKRSIGSWSRLLNMVGDISKYNAVAVSNEQPKEKEPEKQPEKIEQVVPKTKGA